MKSPHRRLSETGVVLSLYAIIILLGVVVFHPVDSDAYSYLGHKWTAGHADYWLDIAGWDPTLIINPSFAWTNAAPSPFYFTFKGHSIAHDGDGKNDVTRYSMATSDIAVTGLHYSGVALTETDTIFNMNYGWGCCGEPNLYDVKNTMTHEFGHWLALGDLTNWVINGQKTMYYQSALGETKKQTLESDDVNGINYIYP